MDQRKRHLDNWQQSAMQDNKRLYVNYVAVVVGEKKGCGAHQKQRCYIYNAKQFWLRKNAH